MTPCDHATCRDNTSSPQQPSALALSCCASCVSSDHRLFIQLALRRPLPGANKGTADRRLSLAACSPPLPTTGGRLAMGTGAKTPGRLKAGGQEEGAAAAARGAAAKPEATVGTCAVCLPGVYPIV